MTREELIRYGKDYLSDLITSCCEISDIHKEFVREAVKALEQQYKILQILDDYELEAWEILEMIKKVVKVLIEIEDESTTEDLIDIQRDYAIDYKVLSGMTNGEIIMTLFNCMVIEISNGKVYVEHIYFPFDEDWWNAPYKVEMESEE